MKTKESLGNEPAFPNEKYSIKVPTGKFSYGEQEFKTEVVFHRGMSKRFFAANNSIAIADNMLKAFSIKSIAEFIGVEPSEYKHYLHYPVALSKMSYVIADEMLRQENV